MGTHQGRKSPVAVCEASPASRPVIKIARQSETDAADSTKPTRQSWQLGRVCRFIVSAAHFQTREAADLRHILGE
jgi:hypothetical protein